MFNKREAVERTKAVIGKQYGYDYQRGKILINYPLFQALLSISSIPYSAYWLPQPTFCQQQPCSS